MMRRGSGGRHGSDRFGGMGGMGGMGGGFSMMRNRFWFNASILLLYNIVILNRYF